MTSYAFDDDYDHELQVRAANIILRHSTKGRPLATRALQCKPGATRQSALDRAIGEALADPKLDVAPDDLDVLIRAMWIPDEYGQACRPVLD